MINGPEQSFSERNSVKIVTFKKIKGHCAKCQKKNLNLFHNYTTVGFHQQNFNESNQTTDIYREIFTDFH